MSFCSHFAALENQGLLFVSETDARLNSLWFGLWCICLKGRYGWFGVLFDADSVCVSAQPE